DSIFCATAVTNSMELCGIVNENTNTYLTETLVTHKSSGDTNIIKKKIFIDKE
ncbi:hypothetical protein IDG86_05635, partial [Pelagibacterales bacterium SAG-MED13]|nr:hypothetical protein [Pelagibacterales bacterium SAG-MED13]